VPALVEPLRLADVKSIKESINLRVLIRAFNLEKIKQVSFLLISDLYLSCGP